jgi:hypothetical protein
MVIGTNADRVPNVIRTTVREPVKVMDFDKRLPIVTL